MTAKKESTKNGLKASDFTVEKLGECTFDTPLTIPKSYLKTNNRFVLYPSTIGENDSLKRNDIFTLERPGPFAKIFFDPHKVNVGIVTCGGLCPGLNDVIRAVTYSCLANYGIKNVYGFKYGYEGLTSKHANERIILTPDKIDTIHEKGGTILSSSRGDQNTEDIVDTLVKYNISILFLIGGDGTQSGGMEINKVIKKRKLDISVIGIPKTIDNDISFIYKTFGFDTAVEEAMKAIDAAHVEAKGARNGIGLVKLMGRHSGFIAANATLASANVNICLIPEEPFDLEILCKKIKKRLTSEEFSHLVIVVAEGVGQDLLQNKKMQKFDASGNLILEDIGLFIKRNITEYLKQENITHTIKYIDPSYMIRSTRANAIDSSFCLQLGNYAAHAAMAGRTNCLIGFWNQHFCLVPTKLALSKRKHVNLDGAVWRAVKEVTISDEELE